jgi:uncharacterized protein (TIGR00369 family)
VNKARIAEMERELQCNPYDRFMQFHVLKADEDDTELVFHNVGTKWGNPNGTLYGGVLYSMADSAMETACAVVGKAVLTLDLAMNYLRPALADTVICAKTHILHNGRTTMVVICDFYDDSDRYLAHGKGTYFVTGAYQPQADKGETADEG